MPYGGEGLGVLQIQCPHCGSLLHIPERYAGQVGKCKHCAGEISVPALRESVAPVSPEAAGGPVDSVQASPKTHREGHETRPRSRRLLIGAGAVLVVGLLVVFGIQKTRPSQIGLVIQASEFPMEEGYTWIFHNSDGQEYPLCAAEELPADNARVFRFVEGSPPNTFEQFFVFRGDSLSNYWKPDDDRPAEVMAKFPLTGDMYWEEPVLQKEKDGDWARKKCRWSTQEETIDVPLGTLRTIRVDFLDTNMMGYPGLKLWIAPKIGIVQMKFGDKPPSSLEWYSFDAGPHPQGQQTAREGETSPSDPGVTSSPSSQKPLTEDEEAFFAAVREGDEKKVTQMLSQKPQLVFCRELETGRTPFLCAASTGKAGLLNVLSRRTGPTWRQDMAPAFDAVDEAGNSALHLAVLGSHYEVVETLLGFGAPIMRKNREGKTVLELTELSGSPEMTVLVRQHAAEQELVYAVEEGDVAKVESLLLKSPDAFKAVDHRNDEDTLLHVAARAGKIPMAQWLLAHGFSVESTNKHGETPLHTVAETDHVEMAGFLIQQGADLAATNGHEDGKDPLRQAIFFGSTKMVRYFTSLVDDEKALELALGAALWETNIEQAQIICERSHFSEEQLSRQLIREARMGKEKAVQFLLDEGADPNLTDGLNTALWAAIESSFDLGGRTDVIRTLLKAGADPRVKKEDGQTLLEAAQAKDMSQAFDLLKAALAEADSH